MADEYALRPMNRHEGRVSSADGHNIAGMNFTPEGRQEAFRRFCQGYIDKGSNRAGCLAAGINYDTFKYWRKHYPAFVEMYDDAKEAYNDRLREEIHRRGAEGVERIKKAYYKGEIIDEYTEIDFSDVLLIFQAKARMPEYRDRDREAGEGAVKIPLGAVRDILSRLDDETPVEVDSGSPPDMAGGIGLRASGEPIEAEFRRVD